MNKTDIERAFILQATWRPLALLLPIDIVAFLTFWKLADLAGHRLSLSLLAIMLGFTALVVHTQARMLRKKLVDKGAELTPDHLKATVSTTLVSPLDPITTHDICADALSCVSMAKVLDYGLSPHFRHDPFRGTMSLHTAKVMRYQVLPEAVTIRIESTAEKQTLVHITRTPGLQWLVAQSGEALRTVTAAREFIEHRLAERARTLATERQNEQLEKAALQARLSTLQAQVEPHFLYNTLANLRHLIRTDDKRALELLDHMVDYFQVAMPGLRATSSTVEREVRLASSYLSIMQIRMGDRLSVSIEMAPECAQLPVPPAMLISLVENAIKHGIEPAQGAGVVRVIAKIEDKQLVLQVLDDGVGLADQPGQGVGLENIHERLRLLYGTSARLVVEPASPGGVSSSLILPIAN